MDTICGTCVLSNRSMFGFFPRLFFFCCKIFTIMTQKGCAMKILWDFETDSPINTPCDDNNTTCEKYMIYLTEHVNITWCCCLWTTFFTENTNSKIHVKVTKKSDNTIHPYEICAKNNDHHKEIVLFVHIYETW